ncbi:MAG: HlyD family efflux transporter periplasmic adaptor subunit [Draconibacterium sp.]|nr:HlyD family efflux transporter periplasmic adaptor subunit [Draconibacterium sp.]
MSWRKITFIVVALIILLGGSAALSKLFVSMKPEPPRMPDKEMKRFVKAETVKYDEIISSVAREGRVVSSSEITLVAEASGKIEKGSISLRKGASFKKGQLIAEIYKDEVELALKARKSRFLTTIITLLPDIKVDFPDQLDAYEMFFRAINMEEDLPEMPVIRDEKLKIFLASRNVLSEFYGIQQDEKRLKRHSLYAPFNGTFTLVNFEVGGYINTGGQIAKMIRTDQLEVEVPVENKYSKWIKIGDKVRVFSKNRVSEMPGVVIRKSNFINVNTQSRSIFVKVQHASNVEMLAGEYKIVEFPGQKIAAAMEIARSAVFNSIEVFVIIDGKLKKQEINIIKTNETTLIFNGLKEGVKVVVEPLVNVQENSPVGVIGEEQPKPVNKKGAGKSGQGNPKSKEKA